MDFTAPAMREASLVEIVNGGHVIIDKNSSILCPVGSRLYVDSYSHGSITRSLQTVDSCALVVKMYSIYCERCPNGFYPRGGGGVLLGILGGGVPPGSSNPDPISDLIMPFSTPVFRPDL